MNSVVLIIFAIIVYLVISNKKKAKQAPLSNALQQTGNNSALPYRKKILMTSNEREYFNIIKEVADPLGLYILAKVKLSEITEPLPDAENFVSLLGGINTKYVEFLLCTSDMDAFCVIEPDGPADDDPVKKEQDGFTERLLADCGIPLIRADLSDKESLADMLKSYL